MKGGTLRRDSTGLDGTGSEKKSLERRKTKTVPEEERGGRGQSDRHRYWDNEGREQGRGREHRGDVRGTWTYCLFESVLNLSRLTSCGRQG